MLRGIHYQAQLAQEKLVKVIEGAVYNVIIDLSKKQKLLVSSSALSFQLIIKTNFGGLNALHMDSLLSKIIKVLIVITLNLSEV